MIDRFDDNASIIQVSRKVAQLLGFYKNRLAKVKVEIMSDPSKQWKSVSKSINEPDFNNTVKAAPTDIVSISNIDEKDNKSTLSLSEKPIELYQEEIENNELYLKIYNFKNYEEIKSILTELELNINNTSESVGDSYNLILGPINNEEGNNLVSSFITKGYKKTEFIIKWSKFSHIINLWNLLCTN